MISRARVLATAALLGLPVALVSHALVFGGEHAAGGALDAAAMSLAAFGMLVVIALQSHSLVQGSILANRLRAQMPSFFMLAASGAAWFSLLELCESAHSLPLVAVAAAIGAACLLVRIAVDAIARSIAAVAIVLCSYWRHIHALAESRILLRRRAPRAQRSFAHTRRLFSRPPPVLS